VIQVYENKIETLNQKHQLETAKATKQALTSSRNSFKRELGELFCPFPKGISLSSKRLHFYWQSN